MLNKKMTDEQFKVFLGRYTRFLDSDPKMSPSKKLIGLSRMYEKHHYGVTTRDLARGFEEYTHWDNNRGKFVTLHQPVHGGFVFGGAGNDNPGKDPVVVYQRAEAKQVDGKVSEKVLNYRDGIPCDDVTINLYAESTGRDMGDSESLLESAVDTIYGTTAGVITPGFVDRMMRLVSVKSMGKNFCQMVPMQDMTFYFPIKNSVVTDNSTAVSATAIATNEGRAGLDINVKFTKWEVNGWKFLRHAELSDEVQELISKYINVVGEYNADLAEAHALLWDYSTFAGWYSMLTAGVWRRWDATSTAAMKESNTEIPFGAASVLTTNAKANYLYQDGVDGVIHEPSVTTTEELEFHSSTVLAGSTTADLLLDGIKEVCHLLKAKKSKAEFVLLPEKLSKVLTNDARFPNNTIATGLPEFQNENGYLGRINIYGTATMVDLWEYSQDLFGQQDSDDATPCKLDVVFVGSYGKFWNLGVYSPFYARVDEGYEVVANRGVVTGFSTLRANETKVITTGSKGSSFPGDYHHLAMLLWSNTTHS